jgi:exo-1,4-beta-D-glucosaminidase
VNSADSKILKQNGISSRADIYLNGFQIASKTKLKGAYGGQKFDITSHVQSGANVLLIRAYPTDYQRDFGVGWVDWNPSPADNGTGVWREVTISQTGPVSLAQPYVNTDYKGGSSSKVTVTIQVDVKNLGKNSIDGTVKGIIEPSGVQFSSQYNLKSGETKTLTLTASLTNPKIWWPKLWGSQPTYTVILTSYMGKNNVVSDKSRPRTFGIRHVISSLNSYEER